MKWSSRQLSERPSICLQMEVLNSKVFFFFFFFFFTSCPRQRRNVSPRAGECVILLCHSKLRLSFPLKCLRWKNIMALVSTPQPPIRLIMPSLSPDKCQSAFFFPRPQLTKGPYLNRRASRPVCEYQAHSVIKRMSLHNWISIRFCWGRAGRLTPTGGTSL